MLSRGTALARKTETEMRPAEVIRFTGREPAVSFSGPCWFAVFTNPNCEIRAQLDLEARGYRTFLPKLKKWVSHARTKRAVEKPLLSRYLFVEVDYPRQSFGEVKATNGVEALLSNGGMPQVIPRQFVEAFIRRYMQGEWNKVDGEKIPRGAHVRIVEGQFDDLLAVVTNVSGHTLFAQLADRTTIAKLSMYSVRPETKGVERRKL
jgi:transcription antitermination factor NusG